MSRARPVVLFCTNRYRTYDQLLYETLAQEFELRTLWINPAPADEPVPAAFPGRYWIVGADRARLTPRDVPRSTRLLVLATRLARGADLVVASTSSSWKARLLFTAARVTGRPFAVRTDIWRDAPSGARRSLRARWQRAVTDQLERRADAVLVCGVKAAEYVVGRGAPAARVMPFRYLHPDLAERTTDEALVGRLRTLAAGRVVFLYLGRIMPQKGLVALVAAFRQVTAGRRDAVLFVVGAPITDDTGRGKVSVDYHEEARALAASDPRIHFLGAANPGEVHNYYAVADVFVHSHVAQVAGHDVHEGWGNVITEAACMGKAIIATDRIPACFDVVADEVNGFLIPAARLDAELPARLQRFVDEPELARRFGLASRRRYETFADPALNIAALRRVIERGLPGHEVR